MMTQTVDYATAIKASPLASRMGGVIENTKNGFKISDASIYSRNGKDIFVEDIQVYYREPGNEESIVIEYGHRGGYGHFITTEPKSMSEAMEIIADETVPFSESEWLEMWNDDPLSKKGSYAVIVGKNTLLINEYAWDNGETSSLVVRAYVNQNTNKRYFTVFHPDFYVVYRDSFEGILSFLKEPKAD